MAITYMQGDIFKTTCHVIVNPVNLVGVMGAGMAKECKLRYPEMFQKYKNFCDNDQFKIGQLWLYKHFINDILCFPTKVHWKDKSSLELIEKGLQAFVRTYEKKGIFSIAFPKLGCGLGGLDWESEVKPLMERYLSDVTISRLEIWI